jgi:hypothetical protein
VDGLSRPERARRGGRAHGISRRSMNGEPDVRVEITPSEYIIRIRESAIPREMVEKMVEVFATQNGISVPAITEEKKR